MTAIDQIFNFLDKTERRFNALGDRFIASLEKQDFGKIMLIGVFVFVLAGALIMWIG